MNTCNMHITWAPLAHRAPAEASDAPQGWMERLDISRDLSVYQLAQQFGGPAQGKTRPLGEFTLAFSEPTLTVHTLHSGSALHRELHPATDLSWIPGTDLFRHGTHGQFMPVLDTSEAAKMTVLVVTVRALRELIGIETTQQLLVNLDLQEAPAVKLAPMPTAVTDPLQQCLASGCSGPLHRLYAQTKVLEYVWKLASYAGGDRTPTRPGHRVGSTVQALHDYLLTLEGSMPNLRDLAQKFGESPQCLNRNFVREYGQTIYATVINHRLTQAHRALLGSGVPIKTIAARVGYSHVNHFTHAFKSKFGYTPGSLRRMS